MSRSTTTGATAKRDKSASWKERLEELKTLRDEIRLDVRLASMDLRDEWKELEGKVPDGSFATELKEATIDAIDRLAADVRRFRDRLRETTGTLGRLVERTPVTCQADESIASAVTKMWNDDIGFLPVTDAEGHLVGVITDRDACIAACTRGQRMDDLRVADVMMTEIVTARPSDSLETALARMKAGRVRRLPLVNEDGKLMGVVTFNDLARRSEVDREALVAAWLDIVEPSPGN